jgi:hypothetical protein
MYAKVADILRGGAAVGYGSDRMGISKMSARLLSALIAAAVLLGGGEAEADPHDAPAYVLTYAAPGACPSEASFIADVASHVQDTTRAGSVRVNVTIEEREAGYEGTLVAFDRSGNESSRSIVEKKCSSLSRALAFLAALVIEVGGHLEPETKPVTMPLPSPVPLPVPAPARERADVARPSSIARSAVLLGGIRGGLGPGPRASVEAGAEIGGSGGLLAPSLRLGVLVANGSPDVNASASGAGGSASLWLVSGRVEICPLRFAGAGFVVRPCIGAELGGLVAEGQAALAPHSATEPWVAAEANLCGQWLPASSWFVEMCGGPLAPLVRPRYYFVPDQTLYSVPGLTAQVAIGAGLLF